MPHNSIYQKLKIFDFGKQKRYNIYRINIFIFRKLHDLE